jgi:hypothetical protein
MFDMILFAVLTQLVAIRQGLRSAYGIRKNIWNTPGLTDLERYSVSGLPMRSSLVKRLEPPPLPGPVSADRRVAVVDFRHQLRHRFPAETKRNLDSNVQIDT